MPYLVPGALELLHKHIVKCAIHLWKTSWGEYPVCVQFGALALEFAGGGCRI